MNADHLKDMLADYLGGELGPADRQRFEQYLAGDPEFAAEVASLRKTLSAMRSLEVPAGSVAGRAGSSRAWAALRYAAAILLAFSAGYLVHDLAGPGGRTTAPAVVEIEQAPRRPGWETRFASAYAENAGKSGLARSLVALAQATR